MPRGPDHCPAINRCDLVQELRSETLRFCQDRYCHADFGSCARYHYMKSTGATPPADLLPNGRRRSTA